MTWRDAPIQTQLQSQVKPKCEMGAETCAKRKSTSPCLLAIPAFDRKAGLNNRQTITGEYAYANNFEVSLRALTDYAKD